MKHSEYERLLAQLHHATQEARAARRHTARLQRELDTLLAIRGAKFRTPAALRPPSLGASAAPRRDTRPIKAEATAIIVGSDWHYAEKVDPASVNQLNRYTLDVAERRIARFFDRGARLWSIIERDIPVPHVVLALLGDMISGNIHADLAESNQLPLIDEVTACGGAILHGIRQWATAYPQKRFTVVCASGNHGRITKEQRIHTEAGNSVERLMYVMLAAQCEAHQNVRFIIEPGYHTYLQVYRTTLRFHHGHAIRYTGGVGGLFVPALRTIARWNAAHHADIDIFGHHHTQLDGGNFLANGSLIGYSPFSLRGGYPYQPPQQTFAVIDNIRGKTSVWPIFLDEPGRAKAS